MTNHTDAAAEKKPSIRGISHGSFANRRSIFEQGEKNSEQKDEVKQERRSQSGIYLNIHFSLFTTIVLIFLFQFFNNIVRQARCNTLKPF